jgi:hypothetical protein
VLVDRCKLVAEAYANLDAELLIGVLAEDCVYESQQCLAPLEGKNAIAEIIREKFENIEASKTFVTASVRSVCRGPVLGALGKPCVVLSQNNQEAVVLLELSDEGKISRIDLCVVPSPADTRPLEEDGGVEVTSLKSREWMEEHLKN